MAPLMRLCEEMRSNQLTRILAGLRAPASSLCGAARRGVATTTATATPRWNPVPWIRRGPSALTWLAERPSFRRGLALKSSASSSSSSSSSAPVEVSVDVLVREEAVGLGDKVQLASATLERDCEQALALALQRKGPGSGCGSVEVSVMVTDDEEIRELNSTWRGMDRPTDVLSFPNGEAPPGYHAVVLGDVVISAQTAMRQSEERGHDLQKELRILLVHGILHLLDYDHEVSAEAEAEMAREEARILSALGWAQGGGLIAEATERPAVRLVALDMDGTLLDSGVRVPGKNAAALEELKSRGVEVILATGKARPSALLACEKSGLSHLFSENSPGIFLQGLLVHGKGGEVLDRSFLPPSVVREAFQYAEEENVACCGFLGDTNVTLRAHPRLTELHERYYEPESVVVSSVEEIVAQDVYKILFYGDDAGVIEGKVKPHWERNLPEGARLTRAIPEMLELVPDGTSKASGLKRLLRQYGISAEEVLAVGDGDNDLEMVSLAGIGVAVDNATPSLKEVADHVVSSNDECGAAEAIWKFALRDQP